jgi:hypothetical protein
MWVKSPIPTVLSTELFERQRAEIEELRRMVIELAPDKFNMLLCGYYSMSSREESSRWEGQIVEEVISQAELLPSKSGGFFADRAYCPLCGEGSQSQYESGFSLPEGLRRHLTGWGNSRQCSIIKVVTRSARDYWNDKFAEDERKELTKKQEVFSQRMQTETLYRVRFDGEPELIDAQCGYFRTLRNSEQMEWAEQRLKELGFQVQEELRIKSYIYENESVVVYADPRALGEISFVVSKKPLPKKLKKFTHQPSFAIPDRWKNNLDVKFANGVLGCVSK